MAVYELRTYQVVRKMKDALSHTIIKAGLRCRRAVTTKN